MPIGPFTDSEVDRIRERCLCTCGHVLGGHWGKHGACREEDCPCRRFDIESDDPIEMLLDALRQQDEKITDLQAELDEMDGVDTVMSVQTAWDEDRAARSEETEALRRELTELRQRLVQKRGVAALPGPAGIVPRGAGKRSSP